MKDLPVHNGVEMAEGWPQRIEEAQQHTTYLIGRKRYQRIRYGDEEDDWGADDRSCHDCAATKGQFHVPGCDVERCPRCGGQAISCACPYKDEQKPSSILTARTAVTRFLEQQCEKVERDTLTLLRKAWERMRVHAFVDHGKDELTARQVRKYVLEHFNPGPRKSPGVAALWQQLSANEKMALLKEAFQENTYSRSSRKR
jgi:hypothetical protein